ncbi:uncharacterized protein LOC142162321 [Nicotiana tabacum]|uniref:Uncharacterized protein LOC142162321 n=1 Tax=Nicotiana tabacum TaxID=4097 RepID=A0AC58RPU8_TOBAC
MEKRHQKQKNNTAQWVERSFKDKTGEGIVKINKPCKKIPSQDTLVNKVLNKKPNSKAEGSKSSTFKERVQEYGGRLWEAQMEYDSEENEVPLGAQDDEEPNENDKEEDEQSVNGEIHANDNNTTGNYLIKEGSENVEHINNFQTAEVTEISNYEGRCPEVNDPGGTEDDQLQKSQENPQGHNITEKLKQPKQKTEIVNITVTLEKNQLQLLKRGEEKALVPKKNVFGATSGWKEDNEEGEEPGKSGYDMDQESTTQHLMIAARKGLMEPKQQAKKLERYRNKIGLAQAISNVSNKIWAFIDEVFEVTVMYNMVQQLTLRLFHTESHVEFVLTLIYAKCDAIERIELWDSLYEMARDMEAPWLVGGDFNVIWDEEEKFGGLPVSLNEIDDFRHCINTCNLFDLGFKGNIFTWWNGRAEEDCIFKRLDRCLANVEFQQKFPRIEVQHLSKTGSDHSPMFLKYVVKENWSADFSANPFIPFNHKLKKLKKALSLWSKATFGDIFQKIASMEEVVMVHEVEFEANPTGMNRERLQKVQAELIKCLALEEKYWQQKAGMTWFKEGDRNTKFFHAQVRGRRKRLQLDRIQNSGGTWIEEEQQIAEEAIKFYEEQFTEEATPSSFDIVEHVPNLINTEQNAELIKQPTKEEVKVAVLGLNGDSAGGPDGMSGKFYHSCWDLIGDDLYDMASEISPKSDIGGTSRFVKGKNIVENILLTQEIVTDIRLRTKAGPNVILKLDMTKAYDRISWLFLTKVLRKMGFTERLIGVVFGLVSNNWYSILINGQAHGFFKSSRGIKQGDPVSPTLFILAAEALSRGLNALHTNLYFCGFGMPKWSPKINHLAYADDMIIFSSSDETSLMLIMQVLKAYENASGQLVNKTKSAVYLHHLTDMEVVSKVERITGIHRNDFPIIYLGCPIFYARRKLEFYQPLITKVMDKLQSWKDKLLSVGAGTVGGTSMHWASWNTLCMPIEEGGICFRSLHDVAKALFSKLWWNFRTKPSLWSSFVCQKYCKKLNPVIVPWKRGSHIWRKMLECRDLIEHQILWQTKMGSSLFWYENWTGLEALYFLVPQDFGIDKNVHNVNDVTLYGEWDVDRLYEILPEDLAVHIMEKIKPPSPTQVLDRPCWMLETRGYFSVKSTWEYTRRRDEPRTAYRMIWATACHQNVGVVYSLMRNLFSTFFFRSETAKTTWKYFLSRAGIDVEGLTMHQAITKCWTANVCLRLKPIMQALPSCIVWELWKRRNSMKYGDGVTTSRVIYQVSSNLQALVKVRKPGMIMVPHKWQDLLAVMENFTPKFKVTKVMWEFPSAR